MKKKKFVKYSIFPLVFSTLFEPISTFGNDKAYLFQDCQIVLYAGFSHELVRVKTHAYKEEKIFVDPFEAQRKKLCLYSLETQKIDLFHLQPFPEQENPPLYKLSKSTSNYLYLWGTNHSCPISMTISRKKLRNIVNKCHILVQECFAPSDESSSNSVIEQELDKLGFFLPEIVGNGSQSMLQKWYNGLSSDFKITLNNFLRGTSQVFQLMLPRLHPSTILYIITNTIRRKYYDLGMDHNLRSIFQCANKPYIELENHWEAIELYHAPVSLKIQKDLTPENTEYLCKNFESITQQLIEKCYEVEKELVEHYLYGKKHQNHNNHAMDKIVMNYLRPNCGNAPIYDRNRLWFPRILDYLENHRKPILIAVGGAHVGHELDPHPDSLLRWFSNQGYTVKRYIHNKWVLIWLNQVGEVCPVQ